MYLVIGCTEFFTVKHIQKKAEVPRQIIHRILYSLEELGLVERAITRPLSFRGIPAKQGISFLVKQKVKETKTMETKTNEMIEKFHITTNNNQIQDVKHSFVLIPKKEPSILKRQEEIDRAEIEIDFITSWKKFLLTIDALGESARKALERGVKIRIILEKPDDLNQIPEQVHEFQKNPKYELRYILEPPEAVVTIFDKKRSMVITCTSVGLAEAPELWTDNPCLLSIIKDYFETMWITAIENIPD